MGTCDVGLQPETHLNPKPYELNRDPKPKVIQASTSAALLSQSSLSHDSVKEPEKKHLNLRRFGKQRTAGVVRFQMFMLMCSSGPKVPSVPSECPNLDRCKAEV